jgi:MYXO-CTERM domain-containing protein
LFLASGVVQASCPVGKEIKIDNDLPGSDYSEESPNWATWKTDPCGPGTGGSDPGTGGSDPGTGGADPGTDGGAPAAGAGGSGEGAGSAGEFPFKPGDAGAQQGGTGGSGAKGGARGDKTKPKLGPGNDSATEASSGCATGPNRGNDGVPLAMGLLVLALRTRRRQRF